MRIPNIDIISALDTLIGASRPSEMHQFQFDVGSGYTGYQVERMLRRYGVRIWGRKAQGDKRSFLVRSQQAVWAEYLLCRMGVPLETELLDPRNQQYSTAHGPSMPTPWAENGIAPVSLIERLGEMLARYLA